mgnify:FL=1
MSRKSQSEIKRVVVIGGGTGTFVTLSGLKKYPLDLTAVVTMADSGGSNRMIRDEFGYLPPSDVRQGLVALDEDATTGTGEILRKLFMYRFDKGTVKGHTFGNLFLAALRDITGDQLEAIRQAGKLLHIKGRVLPVSLDDTNLVAQYEDGRVVEGEHEIDEPSEKGKVHIKKLSLKPPAQILPKAQKFIGMANLIVIGPGDLYTSLLANTVVDGVPEALQKTKAKIAYVVNLMTKFGQTYNFTASDHVQEVEKYIGRKIDYVVFNTQRFPTSILKKYLQEHELPVVNDLAKLTKDHVIIREKLLGSEEIIKASGDVLRRSFIRHDADKLAAVLFKLVE